jgi:hypothetical protein
MCNLKIVVQTDGADGRLPTVAPPQLVAPLTLQLVTD